MIALLRKPVSIVWMVLTVLTCASTWMLSTEVTFSSRIASVGIFLIAAFKVHLIMLYFMELRDAPPRVLVIFESWIGLAVGTILVVYFFTCGG